MFVLRQVAEKARERGRKMSIAFLDLGKVYGRVDKGLWKMPRMG